MAKKAKLGKTPIVGGKKDGARPSEKGQASALLKANKVNPGSRKQSSRAGRIAKMEKSDMAC